MNWRNFALFFFLIHLCKISNAQHLEILSLQFDSALIHHDYHALDELLDNDFAMGHSNAYVQSKKQLLLDLRDSSIQYHQIKTAKWEEEIGTKDYRRTRRQINVIGLYKKHPFDLKLEVMEIWLKKNGKWKLWSRQSVKLPETK